MFKDRNWESTERINTCDFRSHYIPFSRNSKQQYIHGIIDKYSSDELFSLNGDWEFEPHFKIADINNISEKLTKTIDVPSCVQCRGYDYFQYINFTYPFPFNPPYVPNENPTFHYRKSFELNDIKNLFIIFEGVDSAFYLYINNQYIGYSQISHSKSEFNISKFVKRGLNIVDVIVLKWCASSYLEDQDKFRFTGIFRDVYLLNRPDKFIWDYKIESKFINNNWYILVNNLSSVEFNVLIKNKVYKVCPNEIKKIIINNPHLWSSSDPYLYDVLIYNDVEEIHERIGLRKIEIQNKVFKINDEKIKLKGINRHESNPYNGSSVTLEDTYKDLKIIKKLNANAIRTSHYPDIPEFYELCDLMGIYVVDEADVESHGAVQEGYSLEKWQTFANNGIYDNAVYDREKSLYERDKNRTCVIIWSLGNESNWGKMFYRGADYIHEHDLRPIHYEGIFNLVDKSDYYTKRIDINSMMYPSFDVIKERYLNDKKETRPLMLCEYTHAMGNSCGDVKDYWDFINKHDEIIGAFVWEFCDHAVIVNKKIKYGSDFNDHFNDKNFCVDGMVTCFRKLKSSALEVQDIYANKKRPSLLTKKINIKPNIDKMVPFSFNKQTGQININDILIEPIELSLTRANIDNEMFDINDIDKIRNSIKHVEKVDSSTYKIQFISNGKILVECIEKFEINNDILKLTLSYTRDPKIYIQRVGFKLALDNSNDKCSYYGFGPYESYCDKHNHSKVGKYSFKVSKCKNPYLKSQDYGSHFYTSYVEFKDLLITANHPFSFSALPNSEDDLLKFTHNYDLPIRNIVFVNFDVATAGVGSHSCGPLLNEKYLVPVSSSNTFYLKIKN